MSSILLLSAAMGLLGIACGLDAEPTTRPTTEPSSVLDFAVRDNTGNVVNLADYRGKVLLIVNTASRCGLTPQYEGLQKLYETHKDAGLAILAFPANEFGQQEPGTNEQIRDFCTTNYHVTFDLFSKIIVKGDGIAPLYQFLTSPQTNPASSGEIQWNFTKFLISRDGQIVSRFEPAIKPDDPAMLAVVEAELAKVPRPQMNVGRTAN